MPLQWVRAVAFPSGWDNLNTFQLNPGQFWRFGSVLGDLIGFRPTRNDLVDVWAFGRFWRKILGVLLGFGPIQSDLVDFLTICAMSERFGPIQGDLVNVWAMLVVLGVLMGSGPIQGDLVDLGRFGPLWRVLSVLMRFGSI